MAPEDPPATDPGLAPAALPAAGPRVRRVPAGDDRERLVCPDCDYIAYENPKIVCGSVVTDRPGGALFLICRRAIAPRRGFWTLPAGYLELGETVAEAAAREAREEACARLVMGPLMAVYSLPAIGQVQMFFRAHLADPALAPGPESLEVALVAWEDIPWAELAFPTVRWALEDFRAGAGLDGRPPVLRDRPVPPGSP